MIPRPPCCYTGVSRRVTRGCAWLFVSCAVVGAGIPPTQGKLRHTTVGTPPVPPTACSTCSHSRRRQLSGATVAGDHRTGRSTGRVRTGGGSCPGRSRPTPAADVATVQATITARPTGVETQPTPRLGSGRVAPCPLPRCGMPALAIVVRTTTNKAAVGGDERPQAEMDHNGVFPLSCRRGKRPKAEREARGQRSRGERREARG